MDKTPVYVVLGIFAFTFLVIITSIVMNTCNAVRGGDSCEFYRYSPQKNVLVSCVEYLKSHPQRP